MGLKIRLRQQGRMKRHFYRLVLTDSRSPRDGKYIENLGWYNPMEEKEELHLSVKADRVQHWLEQGAELSGKAEALVKQAAPSIVKALHEKRVQRSIKNAAKRRERRQRRQAAAAEAAK